VIDERKLVYLGNFEAGLHHLIIPAPAIRKVEAVFDAERRQREMEAERARLAIVQAAKSRSKLKRAMHAVFRRRGR
jgi:hypothetical protein